MADRLAERTVVPLKPHYRRVLLKISGEALMGPQEYGLDQETVDAHRPRRRRPSIGWASRSAW